MRISGFLIGPWPPKSKIPTGTSKLGRFSLNNSCSQTSLLTPLNVSYESTKLGLNFSNSLHLIRHIVSSEWIRVDSQKIEAVKRWPKPTSPIDIRTFLGLDGYYRRFVEGFSSIVFPLTKLTQKKVKLQWSDDCEKSFSELKTRLTTTPILTLREGSDGYVINCDASKVGLGCVLMQRDVFTNHKSLQYVFTQKELNLRQRRWLEFLKNYDMNVLYHPDKTNIVANAHSRLSMGSVTHVEEERKEQAKDVHQLARLGICLMSISDGTPHKKSAENGLVQRSTDSIDGPSIDPRTVNGIRKSQMGFVIGCTYKFSPSVKPRRWTTVRRSIYGPFCTSVFSICDLYARPPDPRKRSMDRRSVYGP
ncbi:hypothetical protein MTR67_007486 [Solanum verrucosum]|uniref:Reverse transcriptase/retrotransposon-derived protein RNase H-like domain-containing protein n=1 Tax=Solanum verrucosum TaxID=315347 RepID=A0AAF0PZZ9_SOLVR|nr:hypothetical protein MTR67_007486 [Solanum verrucosum]